MASLIPRIEEAQVVALIPRKGGVMSAPSTRLRFG